MAARRRKRRTPPNYYASRGMKREDRAALRRAAKIDGLADEIAMIRLEIKKALDEEDADRLKVLADAVKTLARAVLAQKKALPEGKDWLAKYEESLIQIHESLFPRFDQEIHEQWKADNERSRIQKGYPRPDYESLAGGSGQG